MTTVLVDYQSGNLHSAEKALRRMAEETDAGPVVTTSDPDTVRKADRVVLPGDGAFPACRAALGAVGGLADAIEEVVVDGGKPFLGICIGMQMMATLGREYTETPGFDWIAGEVTRIQPADETLKVPHMGWNDMVVTGSHPVLAGVATGAHVYFVHSFQFVVDRAEHRLAHAEYGGPVTAIVGRDTMIGTQFHPEKSQSVGLQLLANFLRWAP